MNSHFILLVSVFGKLGYLHFAINFKPCTEGVNVMHTMLTNEYNSLKVVPTNL